MEICSKINYCIENVTKTIVHYFKQGDEYLEARLSANTVHCVFNFAVFICTMMMVYISYFIIVPYDFRTQENIFFFSCRLILGIFYTYSLLYHFYKCRTAVPVKIPPKTSEIICEKCNSCKPPMTHHCKTCNKCIYRMDHHCPWMGQCVGAHNQAHFFLFLFNLWICIVLIFALERRFWIDHGYEFFEHLIAERDNLLDEQTVMCMDNWRFPVALKLFYCYETEYGRWALISFTFFAFLLLTAITFCWSYIFLVSGGDTWLAKMIDKDSEKAKKPMNFAIVKLRWRQYLVIRNESFLTALFIPSSRQITRFRMNENVKM